MGAITNPRRLALALPGCEQNVWLVGGTATPVIWGGGSMMEAAVVSEDRGRVEVGVEVRRSA